MLNSDACPREGMKHEGDADEVSRETSQAIAEKAREVLKVLVQHLVDEPVIDERLEPGLIRFELSGSSTGLLIGRGGRTLDALEYLVNRIALRDEVGAAPSRIEIDVAKYRARRAEALEELAQASRGQRDPDRPPRGAEPDDPPGTPARSSGAEGRAGNHQRERGTGRLQANRRQANRATLIRPESAGVVSS